jgi:ornithine cyclodeaminase
VADHALVVAIGSHEPGKREVDSCLVKRSVLVVEDVVTALREAGDLIIPIKAGDIAARNLVPLREALGGSLRGAPRPRLFKSVGMAWEDLAVAERVLRGTDERV